MANYELNSYVLGESDNDDSSPCQRNFRISLKILVSTIWISINALTFLIKKTIKIGVHNFSSLYSLIGFLVLILILLTILVMKKRDRSFIFNSVLNLCFCLSLTVFVNLYFTELGAAFTKNDKTLLWSSLIFVLAVIYLSITKYLCGKRNFKYLGIVSAVYGLIFISVLFCTFYFCGAGLKYFFIIGLYFISVYLHSLVAGLEKSSEFKINAVLCEFLVLMQLLVGYLAFKGLEESEYQLI